MLKMLGDKKLTPIYQYIREEGSSENRIYTVNCTINSLVLEVFWRIYQGDNNNFAFNLFTKVSFFFSLL